MIHETFQGIRPDMETLVQAPGMTEDERTAFLERFSRENPKILVGFAVMGGIFGEGIDLVGERLCGAAIVGVGLPAITPERELVRDYFEKRHGNGFGYAYVYPGINRVLQAAGRVIRTETDRGVVLLIDRRFSLFPYRTLLPKEWRTNSVAHHESLQVRLKRFWSQDF